METSSFRTGKRRLRRRKGAFSDGDIGFHRKKVSLPGRKTSFAGRPSTFQASQTLFERGKGTCFWKMHPLQPETAFSDPKRRLSTLPIGRITTEKRIPDRTQYLVEGLFEEGQI